MKERRRTIALDAYAAIRCPVKVQNYYDATITLPEGSSGYGVRGSSDVQQELFGGRDFINRTLATLAALPGTADLRLLADEDYMVGQDATRDAVQAGAPVILGPRLPIDPQGHRRGSPPVLVRGADRADGKPGYLPVQIRAKHMLERHSRSGQLTCSPLATPDPSAALPLTNARLRSGREDDQLHVAHFWRLLEAAGWQAAGEPLAGIIGNDVLRRTFLHEADTAGVPALGLAAGRGQNTFAVAWVQLTNKQIRTFSRTSPGGWKPRSPLERYDHEHGFRVKVAQTARKRTGDPNDPRPMVTPIFVRECNSCAWWSVCAPAMGEDDLSRRIDKSPLDVREISVLRSLGVHSVHDLGKADLDELLPSYLPEVRHRDGAENRLRLAARRARMIAADVDLERITEAAIELPESTIEIDWDIETSAADRIYLWGFLVRDRSDPADQGTYHSFVSFTQQTADDEIDLACRAMDWLLELLAEHPDARVYHYSDYEMVHLAKLASISGDPILQQAQARLATHHLDLFEVMKRNYFGAHGLGLKVVAHSAAGFNWRDDTPGGLNSQAWFVEATRGADAQTQAEAQQRILDYNEDDVRATLALRDWLRTEAEPAGSIGDDADRVNGDDHDLDA